MDVFLLFTFTFSCLYGRTDVSSKEETLTYKGVANVGGTLVKSFFNNNFLSILSGVCNDCVIIIIIIDKE